MNVQQIAQIIVICATLLSAPTAMISTAFAGAQPGPGIIQYDVSDQISDARRALRTAKRELRRALSRSRSLVRLAERTNNLQRKLRYLRQSVDVLNTAARLRNQIRNLESTLQRLGVAQRVFENQQAEMRRASEEQALREIEERRAEEEERVARLERQEREQVIISQELIGEPFQADVALTTPSISDQNGIVGEVISDVALNEFSDFLTRNLLNAALNSGVLNVWNDQLNNIALEGMVQSKLGEIASGPEGLASLGSSVALGLVKSVTIDIIDGVAEENGVSPLVREPMRFLLNTAGDASIFAALYPEIAAQAPQLVLVVAASSNTVDVLLQVGIVGFDAKLHHDELRSQITQLEQNAEELTNFGFKLRNQGKSEEARAIFELAASVGNSAIQMREIYPYETLLEAAWPF